MEFGAAGDQPGAGGSGAPGECGVGCGAGDFLVAGEAQVVVAGEVEQSFGGGAGAQGAAQSGVAALLGVAVEPVKGGFGGLVVRHVGHPGGWLVFAGTLALPVGGGWCWRSHHLNGGFCRVCWWFRVGGWVRMLCYGCAYDAGG